jgi:hypothetical protein
MRIYLIMVFTAVGLFFSGSCKEKKKPEVNGESLFPVLPYIKSQIAHVDTSLYSIRRIDYIDSSRSDTTYLRRENFKAVAADFLTLPDISHSEYSNRYTEDKQFDETLNRVLIVYTPLNPEKEIIQRQEVLIKPDVSGDQVTSIIINTSLKSKDSLIEKRMLWSVDQSFRVTTIRQLKAEPETTHSYKVVWNEEE